MRAPEDPKIDFLLFCCGCVLAAPMVYWISDALWGGLFGIWIRVVVLIALVRGALLSRS